MEKTKARRDYLQTWLERHQKANEVSPVVREALEEAEWELGVLRDRPAEAVNISTTQLDKEADIAFNRISIVLPQMPEYRVPNGFQVSSSTATSTSATLSFVQAVGEIGTPAATQYSFSKAEEYRQLQESHQRRQKTRDLIRDVVPAALDRFDDAYAGVEQARVGTGSKSAAASEMRNLVDGVQGELFQKARTSPKENMTWQLMAGRLVSDSASAAELTRQEAARASLYDALSQAAKLREGQKHQRVEDLWMRTLDHVFSVLSLVKATSTV